MKDFARFDDVEDGMTRAFNRVVVAQNIVSEFGYDKAKEYIDGFDQRDQLEMATIVGMIRHQGLKKVRDQIVNVTEGSEDERT